MKIVILVYFFPPKWLAGTEIATYALASYMAQRGHEIHVITSLDDKLPSFDNENGFYIHRISWAKTRFVGPILFWTRMFMHIRNIKPDIVQCQSVSCGIPAQIVKFFLRIPYIIWGQGSDIYLPDRFTQLTSKSILQNADAILALTEDMKMKMQNICDRNIIIVPNGIEFRRFVSTSAFTKEDNNKTIIFVGRLHPVKGVQYLIKAMAIVHKSMPDVNLVIVGDGEERIKLEQLATNLNLNTCIKFVGQVPQDRIPNIMHQADIFALPSLSEGFGIVLLEAMASGLPIIATNVGGIPEIIGEGVNGYLVNPRNPDDMAERILMVLRNEDLLEDLSANNIAKASSYAWEKIAESVEEVYQDAIAHQGKSDGHILETKA